MKKAKQYNQWAWSLLVFLVVFIFVSVLTLAFSPVASSLVISPFGGAWMMIIIIVILILFVASWWQRREFQAFCKKELLELKELFEEYIEQRDLLSSAPLEKSRMRKLLKHALMAEALYEFGSGNCNVLKSAMPNLWDTGVCFWDLEGADDINLFWKHQIYNRNKDIRISSLIWRKSDGTELVLAMARHEPAK